MNWTEPLDLYCERVGPAFWAEPLNAITNAAFVIAAGAAYVAWRRAGDRDWPAFALILVMAVIGVGSFAFHTLATRGAVLLDVIPIAVFVYGYFLLALRRFLKLAWVYTAVSLVTFFALAQALSAALPRGFLNGSIDYVPALAAMLSVGLLAQQARVKHGLLAAVVLFTLSLAFRTIDNAVCDAFPLGTHFIWHLLNAGVLYALTVTAIAARPSVPTN
jgi:hypothetical protein